MTDIVITPASVIAGSDANLEHGYAGEAIVAGKVVFKDSASKRYKLADNNATTPPEIRRPNGIALNGAGTGQPVTILESGTVTIGGTLVANTAYYLGDTPGGICPVADLSPGEYPALLGLSTSTTVLAVKIQVSGGAL